MTVIPAEAGIQKRRNSQKYWIPAFAGMTLVVFCFLSHQTLDMTIAHIPQYINFPFIIL